ncbi:hypothetical protein COOONC_24425 [Cooperia oncophora]
MMFTMDSSFNLPCYGTEASASYPYFTISSTALCASGSTFSKGCNFNDSSLHYCYREEFLPFIVARNRSNMWACRLLQLCDNFDREFCQPSSYPSSLAHLIWRFFI